LPQQVEAQQLLPILILAHMARRGSIKTGQSALSAPGYAFILSAALVAWATCVSAMLRANSWIYTWDSAVYVETAESIVAGRGLAHRLIYGLEPVIWQPLALWPPGYPLVVSLTSLLGLSAPTGCVAVSVGASALSVVLLTYICLSLLRWQLALPIVLMVAISVAFQLISTQCMSDAAYYVFAIASVACLVRWSTRERPSDLWALGAGLCAGAAWITRNAGVALLIATAAYFVAHLLWAPAHRIARAAGLWVAGVAVFALPLLLRNLLVFGRLNPYSMPPSDQSFFQNAYRALQATLSDVLASGAIAGMIASKYGLTIGLLALAFVLASYFYRTTPVRAIAAARRHRLAILLLTYAVVYTLLVVIARSRYQWGDQVDSRYMVQVYWAMFVGSALLAIGLTRAFRLRKATAFAAMVAVAWLVVAAQARHSWSHLNSEPDPSPTLEGQVGRAACAFIDQAVADHQIVLATRADLLRIHCGANARSLIGVGRSDGYRISLSDAELVQAAQSGLLWGIVVGEEPRARRGDFGQLIKDLAEAPERRPAWRRIAIESPALVFQFVGQKRSDLQDSALQSLRRPGQTRPRAGRRL
jgi:hypothetical protein